MPISITEPTTQVDMSSVMKWLSDCKCTELESGILRLGNSRYQAVKYRDPVRKDERFYALGEFAFKSNTCYVLQGCPNDWFIAAYMQQAKIIPRVAEYHPFGANFILIKWDAPEPIDQYMKPYRRISSEFVADAVTKEPASAKGAD